MTTTDPNTEAACECTGKRGATWAILIGIVVGLVHGIMRYGVFTIPTVAMTGLGLIVVVGFYAAWIAIRPAKNNTGTTPS